jgi:hypothetical protein
MSLKADLQALVEKHRGLGEQFEVDILRAVAEQGKLMLATYELRSHFPLCKSPPTSHTSFN